MIPARYGSSRFPGKPLVSILGKPLVVRVWERASETRGIEGVVVATDDERIAACVREAGGTAVMTPSDLPSGTDRVMEASRDLDWDVVVNLQGDEPLIEPSLVEELIDSFRRGRHEIATVAARNSSREDFEDPNVVKVVVDGEGNALYFSRAPIPYHRDAEFRGFLRHVGIYAFRKSCFDRIRSLPLGRLERAESLEQLRWLEGGMKIRVIESGYDPVGVDVPGDVEKVERILREKGGEGEA